MAKQTSAEDVKEILTANRHSALHYANDVGVGRVHELLGFAEADLMSRISSMKSGSGTFTDVHLRSTLAQVRAVTQGLVDQMTGTLADEADSMANMAAGGTVDYMVAADNAFRGTGTTPLAFREASVLDSAKMGARSSFLRRIGWSGEDEDHADPDAHRGKQGVLHRYGMNTIGEFEKILRVGVVTRKSIDQVREDLTGASTFLQGKPRFWAERVARTEMMGAYNRASWESQREIGAQLDDEMVKILCATFDNRTAADSYAVHGQIRRPDEAFQTWYGFMQHPPARPNDREIVVPHHISWQLPDYLKAKSDGEVLMRWMFEGHKDGIPARPNMTTVPLDQFGKPPTPKDKEGADLDPTEGMEDMIAKGKLAGDIGDDALQEHGPDQPTNLGTDFEEGEAPPDEDDDWPEPIDGDAIVNQLPPGRNSNVVKHGMKHVPKMPWEGWTEAENNLISTLIDQGAELSPEAVNPEDVVLKGDEMSQVQAQYGVKDSIAGYESRVSIVKTDGVYYAYSGQANALGAKLLGKPSVAATILDLDNPMMKANFPSLNIPEAIALDADNIMATKTGEKKGSNDGGFFTGKDGKQRYVKEYKDPAQANCENIANQLYRKIGLSAPDSTVFDKDGHIFYAHELVDGQTLSKHGLTKPIANKILDGFAADILLGNRDVIGLSNDNILIRPDGSIHRLDNGGSLLMRANAGKKGLADLHTLKEWDGFFNEDLNTYGKVLKEAGVNTHAAMKKQLVAGIDQITALKKAEGGWSKFVDSIAKGMNPEDRKSIIDMLDKRTSLLEEKRALLVKKAPPKPKALVLEPGMWGPSQVSTYENLLAQPKRIAPEEKTSTPDGKPVGAYKSDAAAALMAHTTEKQRSSITSFTGSSYGNIRKASRMTKEKYAKENYGSDSSYDNNRKHAENIEAAFNSIPDDKRIEGTVFRGIRVPRATANSMLANNATPHLPGQGAMFSTTRTQERSQSFLHNGDGDTHVLFVIAQKSGVAVETISGVAHENEILMSGQTKCRLTDHYLTDIGGGGLSNVLVLHLEEVTSDGEPTLAITKVKRARKKKEPTP